MTYHYEWKGTEIEVSNNNVRRELKVDGSTQDFNEGLFYKNAELRAKSKGGDDITVKFHQGLISETIELFYNGKSIKKFS